VLRGSNGSVHREGKLALSRQKTGVPFEVPVMPALQEAIDAMPAGGHLTFLVTAHGKPFSAAGFGNWFRDVCNEAGRPKRCTCCGGRRARNGNRNWQIGNPVCQNEV
jgi:hypothetical protein